MADLRFDLDAFDTAISGYQAIAKSLTEQKDSLKKSIENLKNQYWRSSGGDAFLSVYNEEWVKSVETYVAVLNELSRLLQNARSQYREVEEAVKRLK